MAISLRSQNKSVQKAVTTTQRWSKEKEMAISLRSKSSVVSCVFETNLASRLWVKSNGWSRELETQIKKGSNQKLNHFSATWALHQLVQLLWIASRAIATACVCWLHISSKTTHCRRTSTSVHGEPKPAACLRRAELMDKHSYIIAKSAEWLELERERELERIAKAKRDAAAGEQNLLHSNENERAMKNRLAVRQQLRFSKAARRASRRAVNAMKKTVEVADGTSDFPLLMDAIGLSSRTVFKDVTGLQLVEETANKFVG